MEQYELKSCADTRNKESKRAWQSKINCELRKETDVFNISLYLIRWIVHPAKLLEVLFYERLDLIKRLSVAQPFSFNQFIKEGLREMRQNDLD